MKIAVLSDIHANYPALLAVAADLERWHPDLVVINGDLVNRGPKPAECLQFVLERAARVGWRLIRGNHEDYVILHSGSDAPVSGPALEVHRASHWTYMKLGMDVRALRAMPEHHQITDPDGKMAHFVHGSILGMRDGIYPETSDQQLRKKIGLKTKPDANDHQLAMFVVGHTHRALVRHIDQVLVVNAGSVGLPFDLNPQAGYARLTWRSNRWEAEIIRLEYDRAQAVRDFETSGYLPDGGPLVDLVLLELMGARSHLYNWAVQYQDLTLNGFISVRASVDRYIENNGLNR